MCGFVGLVNLSSRADRLPLALANLAHRGPDDERIWTSWSGMLTGGSERENLAAPVMPTGRRPGSCMLGHRRLAIIDRAGGTQPMTTSDGRLTLVYNGELYNAPELKQTLQNQGIGFETRSDTEVVLAALDRWGTDALAQLDGMFALALWDERERELLVARDRLGVKPLFVAWPGQGSGPSDPDRAFAVASELSALDAMDVLPDGLDDQAVLDYLCLEFVAWPRAIRRGVEQVAPGQWIRFNAVTGQTQRGVFWDLMAIAAKAARRPTLRASELSEVNQAVETALEQSVARQLVADEPLGVLFSGGIDSALITHFAQRQVGRPLPTYTVKFDQSDRHDEAPIAARVAAAMGTQHHELRAGAIGPDMFRDACAQLDQPFGDASYLPLAQCCALASSEITVALTGDGGDELFGGYPRFLRPASAYPDGLIWRALRRMTAAGWLPASAYRAFSRGDERILRHFTRLQPLPVSTRSLGSLLTPDTQRRTGVQDAMAWWLDRARSVSGDLEVDALLSIDASVYLPGAGLTKTDRASMQHGLEARVPMLGNQVLDLVLGLPASTRLKHGERLGLKPLLKTLAKRHLPREAWDRPKRGFTVPVASYLFDSWRPYTQTLIDRVEELAPSLDAAEVRRRWALHLRGQKVDWPVYAVVALLGWLETHGTSW